LREDLLVEPRRLSPSGGQSATIGADVAAQSAELKPSARGDITLSEDRGVYEPATNTDKRGGGLSERRMETVMFHSGSPSPGQPQNA
jgi:hypothetical protein